MSIFSYSKAVLDIMIFPFITNLAILLFLCFTIDIYVSYTEPTIAIGIFALFWWYLAGLIQFFSYGKSTQEWDALLGSSGKTILILTLVITYPIFYVFWLPYVLYHLVVNIGTPWEVWQRFFEGGTFSLDKLIPELEDNKCTLFLNYLYIGIPWVIFTIIYIGFIIFLAPFWLFILSPIGYGFLGIALNVSLRFPSTTSEEIESRIERTHKLGTLVHVYIVCLPMLILGIVHIVIVGPVWYNIFLICATSINFLVDCYTSIYNYFCTDDFL